MSDYSGSFRTRFGYCHVFGNYLVFTKDSNPAAPAAPHKNHLLLLNQVLRGLFVALFAWMAANYFLSKNWGLFVAMASVAIVWAFFMYRSLSVVDTNLLERRQIERVTFSKQAGRMQLPVLEFWHTNSEGRLKRRIIPLPDAKGATRFEVENTLAFLRREGLVILD